MGLLYKREKRAILGYVVLFLIAVMIITVTIHYWYVVVPILGLLAWGVVAAMRNASRRQAEAAKQFEKMMHPDA